MANEKDLKKLAVNEKQNVDGGYIGRSDCHYAVYDDETDKKIPGTTVENYDEAVRLNNFCND